MAVIASPEAVAIDLDGTLIDTAGDIAAAANAMLREIGRPALADPQIKSFVGKGLRHLVSSCLDATVGHALQTHSVTVDDATQIASCHYAQRLTATSRPFPHVIEGLTAMQSLGLKLACVTNKPERFTLPLLARTGLSPYFAAIVSGDSTAYQKPSPEPLYWAADQLYVARAAMVVIGDSANDVAAARNAGMAAWVVPYGYREGMTVDALGADAIVADLREAAERLRDILQSEKASAMLQRQAPTG